MHEFSGAKIALFFSNEPCVPQVPVECGDPAFRWETASIEVFANDAVHFAHHILLICSGQSLDPGFGRDDEWQHAITFGQTL